MVTVTIEHGGDVCSVENSLAVACLSTKNGEIVYRSMLTHNHSGNAAAVEASKIRAAVCEAAKITNNAPKITCILFSKCVAKCRWVTSSTGSYKEKHRKLSNANKEMAPFSKK